MSNSFILFTLDYPRLLRTIISRLNCKTLGQYFIIRAIILCAIPHILSSSDKFTNFIINNLSDRVLNVECFPHAIGMVYDVIAIVGTIAHTLGYCCVVYYTVDVLAPAKVESTSTSISAMAKCCFEYQPWVNGIAPSVGNTRLATVCVFRCWLQDVWFYLAELLCVPVQEQRVKCVLVMIHTCLLPSWQTGSQLPTPISSPPVVPELSY